MPPSPPELFITSGPSPGGQAPLRSAGQAQPAAAGAPWGRAAAGEGRSGPALGRRGRVPGLQRGWGGGRKLPVQIRAEVGPAVRQCGMLPPPPASAEPASASPVPTPRAKGLPGGPLLPAWDSAAWAETPGSSGGWASACSFSSKPQLSSWEMRVGAFIHLAGLLELEPVPAGERPLWSWGFCKGWVP